MPDTFDLLRSKQEAEDARLTKQQHMSHARRLERQAYAELVGDARWQPYVNWLSSELMIAGDDVESLQRRLEDFFLDPVNYGSVKVGLAAASSRKRTLTDVLDHVLKILKEEPSDAA